MKNQLLIASYTESTARTILVHTLRGQNSYRKLSSDSATLSSEDVTSAFPFLFDSHEGGQFFVVIDIDVDFNAIGVEELHVMLHSYQGVEFYSTIWSSFVPVNSVTGSPTSSTSTTAHLEFSVLLKPNQGFALALTHNHTKSIRFVIESLAIKVYKTFPTEQEMPPSGLSVEQVRELTSDLMSKSEFVNPDETVGQRPKVDFNSLLNLPPSFPPSEHWHDERYKTREEIEAEQKTIGDLISALQARQHTHFNKDVLDRFAEKGGLLHYNGKRFDDYFFYLASGGMDGTMSGWAECSLPWNSIVQDNSNDFNVGLIDHGTLVYADFQHGLAVNNAKNIELYLEFCYYNPSEPDPALRYSITNQSVRPLIYPLDDYTVRIVARDHGKQPGGTTNNSYNSGQQLMPCYRVTASRLRNVSGQRPIYHFLGCLRELPAV